MSTSLLYHAFGIRGYKYSRTEYHNGQVIFTIHQEPETYRCSACGSSQVISRGQVERRFRSLPIGSRATSCRLCHPTCGMSGVWVGASGRCLLRRPEAELHQVLREIRTGVVAEHDHPRRGPSLERRLGPDQGDPEARPVAALCQAQAQASAVHRHRRDRRRQGAPLSDGGHGPGERGGGVRRRRQGGRCLEAVLETASAEQGQD